TTRISLSRLSARASSSEASAAGRPAAASSVGMMIESGARMTAGNLPRRARLANRARPRDRPALADAALLRYRFAVGVRRLPAFFKTARRPSLLITRGIEG